MAVIYLPSLYHSSKKTTEKESAENMIKFLRGSMQIRCIGVFDLDERQKICKSFEPMLERQYNIISEYDSPANQKKRAQEEIDRLNKLYP